VPEAGRNMPKWLAEPPPHLTADAREEWDRLAHTLWEVGILTRADRATFAAYCQAYGRWVTAERFVNQMALEDEHKEFAALVVKTKTGHMIQTTMVGVANKAMADMLKFALEMGLTPSARTRINADPPKGSRPGAQEDADETADPADKYFRGAG
jgi:P27 family predicted phage terminase small subunit